MTIHHFCSDEEVVEAVQNWLRTKLTILFQVDIKSLLKAGSRA